MDALGHLLKIILRNEAAEALDWHHQHSLHSGDSGNATNERDDSP